LLRITPIAMPAIAKANTAAVIPMVNQGIFGTYLGSIRF
jgi:hypothetical protein